MAVLSIENQSSMAIDPVCGMQVDEKTSPKSVFNGKEVYFCCPQCKSKFDKDPSRFNY